METLLIPVMYMCVVEEGLSISPDLDHLHTLMLSQPVGGRLRMYTCVCVVDVGMEERQETLTKSK